MRISRFRSIGGGWTDRDGLQVAIAALAWIVIAEPDPEQRQRMLDVYSDVTRVMVQSVISVEVAKVIFQISGEWT